MTLGYVSGAGVGQAMTTFDRLQEYLMLTVGSYEAEAILQLAVQLVEEEREACAKLAESEKMVVVDEQCARRIAAAIRCRE